ncbi:MAG: DUF2029 domain-containing protein [Planctomycetes bacterium]|nr:DUF2029 domain-containing protein [Planctomycetota bacterium]
MSTPLAADTPPGASPGLARPQRISRGLLGLLSAAFLLRLGLSCVSWGSNDARLWERFAELLDQHGLANLYRYQTQPPFNHPPLSAGLGWLLGRASTATGLWFPFLWRLPQIAAEGLVVGILWRRWGGSQGPPLAAIAAAWSVCGIWVSAYHGNTDCLCSALCLLSLYLLESRDDPGGCLRAGLVLGLAINVKLIPALLVPVFVVRCRSSRELGLLLLGLGLCSLPFGYGLWLAGADFVRNVFRYAPLADQWGVAGLIRTVSGASPGTQQALLSTYAAAGRGIVILSALLAAASGWRRRAVSNDGYRLAAWVICAFLVFSPGFGVQYLAYLGPLLLAYRPRSGAVYCTGAGVFLTVVYLSYRVRWFPLTSSHSSRMGAVPTLSGLALWVGMAWWLGRGALDALRGVAPPTSPQAAQ